MNILDNFLFSDKRIGKLSVKFFAFSFFLMFIGTHHAFAHVKWFVTNEGSHINAHFNTDIISLILVAGFLFFLFACHWLQQKSGGHTAIHSLLYSRIENTSIYWAVLKFAVAFLFTANIIQNNFIAPNFVQTPSHSQIVVQASLIITLILNVDVFVFFLGSFSLLSLFIYPLSSAIDYSIELFAIALSIYFLDPTRGNKMFKFSAGKIVIREKNSQMGLMFLRVGLGLQLIILTIHDKLSNPGFALEFLSQHPNFNFMHMFVFDKFSDLHFVLGAGLAELAFGIVLITNIAVRIGLFLILFFFITTGIILGIEELTGHIPIIIAALVLFASPNSTSIFITLKNPVSQWDSSENESQTKEFP